MRPIKPAEPVPVLVLSGTVGAGKTSVGRAASQLLTARRIPHALIDLDWLETFWAPDRDLDHSEAVLHRNIASIWSNYHAAGCRRLIFCRIVETPAILDRLRGAVPGAQPTVVWLDSPPQTTLRNIRAREPEDPSWFLNTSEQVRHRVVPTDITPHVVQTDDRTPTQLADHSLRIAGWIT